MLPSSLPRLKRTVGLVKGNTRVPCVSCAYYKHTRGDHVAFLLRMHPNVCMHRGLYIENPVRRGNGNDGGLILPEWDMRKRGTRLYIDYSQCISNRPAENLVRVPIDGLV